jgi:hypothetical protein
MYVYKTYNPSEPVRKVRYWATKESRQDYLRYQFRTKNKLLRQRIWCRG